jgi:hypothetical protein
MSRHRRVAIVCPRAKPDDGCKLPPGVCHCVCHGDEGRGPVGNLVVRDGQLFWVVRGDDGRDVGGYTYVAVMARGVGLEPVELEGDVELRVRHEKDGRRPCYVVRGRNQRFYEIDAGALVDAAYEGREAVECRAHEPGAAAG